MHRQEQDSVDSLTNDCYYFVVVVGDDDDDELISCRQHKHTYGQILKRYLRKSKSLDSGVLRLLPCFRLHCPETLFSISHSLTHSLIT